MKIERRYKINEGYTAYSNMLVFEVFEWDRLSYYTEKKFFFWKRKIPLENKVVETWRHLYNYSANTSTIFPSLEEAMERIKEDIKADYRNAVSAEKAKDYGQYQHDIVAVMEDGELKITTERKKIEK